MERIMVRSALRRPAKVFTISLRGPLTIGEPVEILEKAVTIHLARGVRRLRLDLRGVPFADAGGLGALVRCREKALQSGAVLAFAGARGKLRELIRLTCLERAGLRSRGGLPADSRARGRSEGMTARLDGRLPRLAPRVA